MRISADDGRIESALLLQGMPIGRILVDDDAAVYVFLEDRDSKAGYLISVDRNLSGVRWTQKSDHEWSSEWPRLWNGLLLAGDCRGDIQSFRVFDGAPQWSDRLTGCLRSIGIDGDGDQIYVGAQQGTVYAYSPPRSVAMSK